VNTGTLIAVLPKRVNDQGRETGPDEHDVEVKKQ